MLWVEDVPVLRNGRCFTSDFRLKVNVVEKWVVGVCFRASGDAI